MLLAEVLRGDYLPQITPISAVPDQPERRRGIPHDPGAPGVAEVW